MILIFLGLPGSGKGTQAKRLCSKFPFVHLSTGDLIRREIDLNTETGTSMRAAVASGEYISDKIILSLVEHELKNNQNYVLDGFPRTLLQAHALNNMINALGQKIILVMNFIIDSDVVLKRLSGRFLCTDCGSIYNEYFSPPKVKGTCDVCFKHNFTSRADDSIASVTKRLQVFNDTNTHVIDYYRQQQNIVDINSNQSSDKIFDEINIHLDTYEFKVRNE